MGAMDIKKIAQKKIIEEPKEKGENIIIDADVIRELDPNYDPNKSWENHNQTSRITDEIYKEALEKDTTGRVAFMAGGSGSGKSEVVLSPLNSSIKALIHDGTLANYKKAQKKIRMALDAGKEVSIHAVYTPIEDALGFAAQRSRKMQEHKIIEKHKQFRESMKHLAVEFPEVRITVTENSLRGGTKPVPIPNRKFLLRYLQSQYNLIK